MIDSNPLVVDGELQELEPVMPAAPALITHRLYRVRDGAVVEVLDGAREARLALYAARHEAGVGIFDGEPPTDAVSVHELEVG
jgi:hypothetical protein